MLIAIPWYSVLHMIVETDPGAGIGNQARLLHAWVRGRELLYNVNALIFTIRYCCIE